MDRHWPLIYAAGFIIAGSILVTERGLVTPPRYNELLIALLFVSAAALICSPHRPRVLLFGVSCGIFALLLRAWDLILNQHVPWQQRAFASTFYVLAAFGFALATMFTGRAGRARDHSE